MLSIVLICLGLVAVDEGAAPSGKPTADVAAYQEAASHAGRDPGAHVRLALWCEAHGMSAERVKHLAAAVLYDPANGLARGLMGLVAREGKWERPEVVGREAKDAPRRQALLEEYLRRRAKAADKADDQSKLATWCEQEGLKDQAVAHYHSVVRLDPKREAAWRHLGYKKQGNRWVKREWQEAERREAEEQGRANKRWRPILERWRAGLSSRDPRRRTSDESALAALTDPRAVPMIWAVFARRGADDQKTAVRLLSQVDSPGASRALAMLAVFGRSGEVRRTAAENLRQRDPRDFLGVLVGLVCDRLKYEIKPGAQPGVPGELLVEGPRYKIRREYLNGNQEPGTFDYVMGAPPRLFAPSVPFDPFGPQNAMFLNQGMVGAIGLWGGSMPGVTLQPGQVPNALAGAAGKAAAGAVKPGAPQATLNNQIMALEGMAAIRDRQIAQRIMRAEQILEISRQQLRNDVQAVESYNAEVSRVNDLTVPILTNLTGVDRGSSGEAWQAWWTDQQGYAYSSPSTSEKPTYTEIVENPVFLTHHSCFAGGTVVQTLDGPRAIESIWAGDQVLSQDVRTGKLVFAPVVAVFHNKPAPTFRVKLKDQAIVATGIHRLWKAGKGWAMVRELKPGDVLRTLGGVAAVAAVEADKTQPVYNLQVADGESYFVGSAGVLAHDNSMINPMPEPFDAVGPLTTTSPAAAKPRSMLGR